MAEAPRKRKNDKAHYKGGAGNKRGRSSAHGMGHGMRGVLLTMTDPGHHREIYSVLNELVETLELLKDQAANAGGAAEASAAAADSVEDSIAKELADLKEKPRLFQICDTGSRCISFVSCKELDPLQLVQGMYEMVVRNKEANTRHIARMIPVQVTCQAALQDIVEAATALMKKDFMAEGHPKVSFAVQIKVRNNSRIQREKVIDGVADVAQSAGHTVDLSNPDVVIVLEILTLVCCVSVVRDFYRFRRGNLHILAKEGTNEELTSKKKDAAAAAAGADGGAKDAEKGE